LLTLATGKTIVAFQICWKLWSSKWNAQNDPTRKPRILYLADRNFLVDDPKDKTFAIFGDARHKIEGGAITHRRDFDGDPAFATQEEIDAYGQTTNTEIETPEEPETGESRETGEGEDTEGPPILVDPPIGEPHKFYFDGGQVEIAAELVYELDANGKQLRVVKLTDYTAENVRTLCASPDDLRARWSDALQRARIVQQLGERGIDFAAVAEQAGQPDADSFDLLCHLAFNAPMLTRRQRADRVKREQAAFLATYSPEAREVLGELLEKYAIDGELQFILPAILQIPPINRHGNVTEIAGKFGGLGQLSAAVGQLQMLLYAA
jgi:type I restriction enzyme R subunit